MQLGDYLSAILQDFTRAKVQADAFARDLARDIADKPEEGDMPVTRFSFGQSTVTTRIAVTEASEGEEDGLSKKTLTTAASRVARSLPDRSMPDQGEPELFALSDQSVAVWRDTYVPRLEEEFRQVLTGELSLSAAASVVGAVVASAYTQFVVDERTDVSESDRNQILGGGHIEELEVAVRQHYQKQLEKQSDPALKEEAPLGSHVEVLVSIDDLADIEDRLLTTIEITLEGETVRWETIDDARGELIQL